MALATALEFLTVLEPEKSLKEDIVGCVPLPYTARLA
jgi:hypothetical protein